MNALEALKMVEESMQQVSMPLNAHVQIQRIFMTVRDKVEAENAKAAENDKKNS